MNRGSWIRNRVDNPLQCRGLNEKESLRDAVLNRFLGFARNDKRGEVSFEFLVSMQPRPEDGAKYAAGRAIGFGLAGAGG